MGRFVVVVIDSCGAGELPDAATYGDQGANTLGNCAKRVGGLVVPNLQKWGLGNITGIPGCNPSEKAGAGFGRMSELSEGKDTTTGHWEMMGIVLQEALRLFPQGFPPEILEPWLREIGAPGVLGNRAESGTEINQQLGE